MKYTENAPSNKLTLTHCYKFAGTGAALLAFGIQLSIDYGYGGAICLKAKNTEIREHYICDFGTIPFSRYDPLLPLIDGNATREIRKTGRSRRAERLCCSSDV